MINFDDIKSCYNTDKTIAELFAENPSRFEQFSVCSEGILLDYSKSHLTKESLDTLLQLADQKQVVSHYQSMLAGEKINTTEGRAVGHVALRDLENLKPEVEACHQQMREFVDNIHTGRWLGHSGKPITHIVNIGIGGSDLGPKCVTNALQAYSIDKVCCHFVSNLDDTSIKGVLSVLNPAETLFVVSSKSFTTLETMANADFAKNWLLQAMPDVSKHMVAVTANVEKAVEYGIDRKSIFPMWDWVGGRYSVWSAIGLPVALSVGMDNFLEFLRGANSIDKHFVNSKPSQNIPLTLALLGIWEINVRNNPNLAVIAYDELLSDFSAYIQQLDMESNGKRVTQQGDEIAELTGPLIWGGVGCNSQHSFFQWLHQGHNTSAIDFVVTRNNQQNDQHLLTFANCIAQSRALMIGKTYDDAFQELTQQGMATKEAEKLAHHKTIPGNKPSNMIVLDEINPYSVGQLLAIYEHKVFVQGVIWGLNSFDQWGVELGKQIAKQVEPLLRGDDTRVVDVSTVGLVEYFKNK